MDLAEAREQEIQQRAAEVVRTLPTLWRRLVDEWLRPRAEPRAWMMYSANYLVRTGEVLWAIDPVRLDHRLPAAPAVNYAADLSALSFVLLTHRHGDHFDLGLIRSLRNSRITWVVPDVLLHRVIDEAGIPAKQIIVPEVSKSFELAEICVTPFSGMHWEKVRNGAEEMMNHGVPAMGYLVTHRGRRWLFPGDTRTYDARGLPSFGSVDILFAHVWLGRAAAMHSPAPLVDSFCRWCIDLHPSRVVLAHLEEFGRQRSDYWNYRHAESLVSRLGQLNPAIDVLPRRMGQSVPL